MHRCDNEFIKENSDIREFSEFRDIRERVASREYAPRGGASLLKYAPREGVGVVGSATSLLNTAPPSAGYPTHRRGLGAQTHKNTHKRVVCRCARCVVCVGVKHTLCAED